MVTSDLKKPRWRQPKIQKQWMMSQMLSPLVIQSMGRTLMPLILLQPITITEQHRSSISQMY